MAYALLLVVATKSREGIFKICGCCWVELAGIALDVDELRRFNDFKKFIVMYDERFFNYFKSLN